MGSLALVAAQGLLPLAGLYLMKLLVDALAAAFQSASQGSANHILAILAVAALVAVLEVVARSLAAFVTEAQTETVTDHLADIIHAKSSALELSYFEDPHYYDMSLAIAAGQHVALVGENGSGKSTLVKLLCRLYHPTEGRILVDGVDLREWDAAALAGGTRQCRLSRGRTALPLPNPDIGNTRLIQ